jgi:pimeloyl-ACP methyl ester carboxylesterase
VSFTLDRAQETDLRDTRLNWVQWGERGPRVVLIHAIGLDHQTWEPIAPFLEDKYQLVALDLPGHGESDKPVDADYNLPALGRRVLRFLYELGWEDAVFVGNSLGGGTSLSAALQAPERVKGLALINSVGLREGLPLVGKLAFLPVVPLATSYAPAPVMRLGLECARSAWGTVPKERGTFASRYLRSMEGRTAFFGTLKNLYGPDLDQMAERYEEIRCPTLVLHGEKDPLIRLSHAELLAEAIPPAELVCLPECGHFPQEEQPEQVASELRTFLDRISRGRI